MRRWLVRLIILGTLAAAGYGGWVALQPRPVEVEVAVVTRAPMSVEIEETGQTRVREIYRISAPVSGRIDRALLKVGDRVNAGKTVVATIHPMDPPFMDARSRAEAEARVEAARAAVKLAEASLSQAKATLELAEADYRRALRLATSDSIPTAQLEARRIDVELKEAQMESAAASVRLRRAELASAKAALIQPGTAAGRENGPQGSDCCVRLTAPIDGVVLSLAVKSEQVVQAGAPLAEIGDPSDLEVVVDLLSSDAVRVRPDTPATLIDWGGDPIPAVVRRIDPAGFVRVSALGIEERRVNAILDPKGPVAGLGHGFEVRVRLAIWQSDDVLQVPLTALFRQGNDWAVFTIEEGVARERIVEVGHTNGRMAEITGGLGEGARVVDFPGDLVSDGVQVVRRRADSA